ncbi:serine/threonine-protein kinase, active site protein, partial [Tanacetum coccineum]
MLLPDTNYTCYLVFKLSKKCHGLHCPVKVKDVLHWKNKVIGILYFRTPSPWNIHDNNQVPEKREDGWMEVIVWKFNSTSELRKDYIPMHLKLIAYEGTMSGLIVGGFEIRPIIHLPKYEESYSKRRNPIAMGKLPVGDDNKLPISTLLIFAALDSEALPIVHHFKLSPDDGSFQNAYGYYVDAIRVVKCVYSFNHHKRYRVQTPLCTHMGMARKMVRNGHVDISVRPSTSQLKTHLPRDFEIEFRRFPLGVPWIRYHGYYKDLNINLIYPGKDRDL